MYVCVFVRGRKQGRGHEKRAITPASRCVCVCVCVCVCSPPPVRAGGTAIISSSSSSAFITSSFCLFFDPSCMPLPFGGLLGCQMERGGEERRGVEGERRGVGEREEGRE